MVHELHTHMEMDLEGDDDEECVEYEEDDAEDVELLRRRPSLLSKDRDIFIRHASLELLNPTHDSRLRKSSATVATFNLVATVCGGGVLSLPYAFMVAGIVPTTLMMIFSAIITDFSLYILCSCARRTGGKSYSDVARFAFGPIAELATTLLLFMLTCFIVMAYMVLVKGIWTPMVLFAAKSIGVDVDLDDDATFDKVGVRVLIVLLFLIFPLTLQRDLHALRNTCYVGFTSLVILCIATLYHAWDSNTRSDLTRTNARLYTTNFSNIIMVFPIVALSFFSSFNVLSVHGSLINPTRRRMKKVLDSTVVLCFLLFYIVGLCGYLCSYDETKDNVFLNFPVSDVAILLGRFGYALTLLFGIPLVLLPCREALLSIPEQWTNWMNERKANKSAVDISSPYIVNGVNFNEERPLLSMYKFHNPSTISTQDSFGATPKPTRPIDPLRDDRDLLRAPTTIEYILHYISTAGIQIICFIGAVAVPGVSIVWSICGSSMAIIIAFIIPSASYLKIRSKKGPTMRAYGAWALLGFSCIAAAACTIQIVVHLHSNFS